MEYGSVTIKKGELLAYLGMQIQRLPDGSVKISQPGYIDKLIAQYDIGQTTATTPYSAYESTNKDADKLFDKRQYLAAVGALNYLAQYTRPDILYAVSRAAQQCSYPTFGDMDKVLRIMRYLNGTKTLGIKFIQGDIELNGWADSSYNCYLDGKSHYGYNFVIGRNDGAFDVKSAKAKLTALSSTEAEYIALCEAVREAIWLRLLLHDLGYTQKKPTVIYQDNRSCMDIVEGRYDDSASKHIRPKIGYVQEQVEQGNVIILYLPTADMVADVLTKPLNGQQHHAYINKSDAECLSNQFLKDA